MQNIYVSFIFWSNVNEVILIQYNIVNILRKLQIWAWFKISLLWQNHAQKINDHSTRLVKQVTRTRMHYMKNSCCLNVGWINKFQQIQNKLQLPKNPDSREALIPQCTWHRLCRRCYDQSVELIHTTTPLCWSPIKVCSHDDRQPSSLRE